MMIELVTKGIWVYLLAVNVIAFFMYGVDKRKARKNKWRIKEATLIIVAVIGGSIGALLGMKVFHHKTKKAEFRIGIPAILMLQIVVTILILVYMKG